MVEWQAAAARGLSMETPSLVSVRRWFVTSVASG